MKLQIEISIPKNLIAEDELSKLLQSEDIKCDLESSIRDLIWDNLVLDVGYRDIIVKLIRISD